VLGACEAGLALYPMQNPGLARPNLCVLLLIVLVCLVQSHPFMRPVPARPGPPARGREASPGYKSTWSGRGVCAAGEKIHAISTRAA
jgi:hypothetical protein